MNSFQDMMGNLPTIGLGPRACAVCRKQTGLHFCGGCKVESYCSAEHQTKHQPKHKDACNAIKKTRKKLASEESSLRDELEACIPKDAFTSREDYSWAYCGNGDYMRARFDAADALLQVNTVLAVEASLAHFQEMSRLCQCHTLGTRDIVPWLLLRLGREQECYDFIKWYATVKDESWGDNDIPYLDIHEADACGVIEGLFLDQLSLSHLAALTLLKLRLYLDFCGYGRKFERSCKIPNPLGRTTGMIVQKRIVSMYMRGFKASEIQEHASDMEYMLRRQYLKLCEMVQEKNPFFWETLIEEEETSPPQYYSGGTQEEADLVVHQSLLAWQESKDSILMVNTDTCKFVREYQGEKADEATLEKRRGTGRVIPSKFEPPESTSEPAELFPITSRGQENWYLSSTDPESVLVYIDGTCLKNGQASPQGGWAVVYGVPPRDVVSGRLEDEGPFGELGTATSNRAELRAAIGALRMCDWRNKGFDSLVLATDSAYLAGGATYWMHAWTCNGWMTQAGNPVRNRDLWEMLLGEVERLDWGGVNIEFWKIPREQNVAADTAAKKAARTGSAEAMFRDILISD